MTDTPTPSTPSERKAEEMFIENLDLELETDSNAVRLFFTDKSWPDHENTKLRFCNEIKAAIERAAEDFKP